jgi:hypothetical protein
MRARGPRTRVGQGLAYPDRSNLGKFRDEPVGNAGQRLAYPGGPGARVPGWARGLRTRVGQGLAYPDRSNLGKFRDDPVEWSVLWRALVLCYFIPSP